MCLAPSGVFRYDHTIRAPGTRKGAKVLKVFNFVNFCNLFAIKAL